jgi:hypothetical protein
VSMNSNKPFLHTPTFHKAIYRFLSSVNGSRELPSHGVKCARRDRSSSLQRNGIKNRSSTPRVAYRLTPQGAVPPYRGLLSARFALSLSLKHEATPCCCTQGYD